MKTSQSKVDDKLIVSLPYRSRGALINFFDDHIELKGQTIFYEDIKEITYVNYTVVYYPIIVSNFTGRIDLKLNNGKNIPISAGGLSVFGIGTTKGAVRRFEPLLEATYSIVGKIIAQKLLDEIREGKTVEIGGFTVDCNTATRKKKLILSAESINRDNFDRIEVDKGFVRIIYKGNERICGIPGDRPNGLILPYILTSLFGNEDEEATDIV